MLRALTRLFRFRPDTSQLELGFRDAVPQNAEELLVRLRQLGLTQMSRARLTRNRNVMVSFGKGELRVHQEYLGAPEPVLRAIVRFIQGRTRAERREAQRVIVAFPIASRRAPVRRESTHADDVEIAERLRGWHARYNADHFEGTLTAIEIRVSRRMKSRLGHYTAASKDGEPAEIAISRAHLRRHGLQEALHTLLHEMVHQWQDETSRVIDHGRGFRAKAREVGIEPFARRQLARKRSDSLLVG